MRRFLATFLCLLPLTSLAAYRTGVSFGMTTASDTLTTGAITTQSGDLAVACMQTTQANPLNTFADFYGNTWTLQEKFAATANSVAQYIYIYTAPMTTYGASETFTATWTGTLSYSLLVGIFSGRNLSTPLDGTPGTYVDTTYITGHFGASMTTAQTGSDVVECATDGFASTSDTYTAGSGFTIGQSLLGSGNTYPVMMFQYDADMAAGSKGPANWTTANYVEGAAVILALAPAGGSCTHDGITSAGSIAVPNGSSGSYRGNSGSFVTPDCSSVEYRQTSGVFGVN